MIDQLVEESATYTKDNEHKRRTTMPSERFESLMPATTRPQTYAIDRKATAISSRQITRCQRLEDRSTNRRPWQLRTIRERKILSDGQWAVSVQNTGRKLNWTKDCVRKAAETGDYLNVVIRV